MRGNTWLSGFSPCKVGRVGIQEGAVVAANDASRPKTTAKPVPVRGVLDANVPHIARIYDYWLGGKDNFEADRKLGELTIEAFPGIVRSVQTNRAFLARAVQFFAAELGIRQFLDIGTGIPTANNTHEVAQAIDPSCRIVYVDNDPIVLIHAAALLRSTPEGACAYVDSDMHDTAQILKEAAVTLDFSQPVGLMLIGILHFGGTLTQARAIVNTLMNAMVPGSGFAITHPASDLEADQMAEMIRRLNSELPEKTTLRNQAEVTRFFDGYELLPPGVVRAVDWRPSDDAAAADMTCAVWGGVGVKRA
jgi:S-adenosyl methyltransferase